MIFYHMMYNGNKYENDGAMYRINKKYEMKVFNKDNRFFSGEILKLDKIYVDVIDAGIDTDFLWIVGISGLNVSPRFKELLEKFNIGENEFIPIYITNSNKLMGYHVNILNYFGNECINYQTSKCSMFGDELSAVVPVFYYNVIKDFDLFSYRENNHKILSHIYISSRIKKEIIKQGITGCSFIRAHTE